jgi:shikimate kinase
LVERILLVGMMGAGKTVVGRRLAHRLAWRHVDSDEQVVAATGRTVRELFEHEGEAAFRREESAALRTAIEAPGPAVISVAGGAVTDPLNRECITAGGFVVWLRAPVPVLAARVMQGGDHRPLLGSGGDVEATLAGLYEQREEAYAEVADAVVDVAALAPDAVVERILELAGRTSRGG